MVALFLLYTENQEYQYVPENTDGIFLSAFKQKAPPYSRAYLL